MGEHRERRLVVDQIDAELGVQLDPANPPTMRTGNRQERYVTFPILLTEPSALAQLQDA